MTHASTLPAHRYFPALLSGRGLDVVKIIAALAMLVDHAGYILSGGGIYSYLVGRIAFPLFCFAAAAAIVRLRDDPSQIYRQAGLLLLFALITEPVSQLTRSGYEAINVLFTLALAMAVAPLMLKAPMWLRGCVYAAAVAAMAYPNAWEFGFGGMMLPVVMALALMGRRFEAVIVFVLLSMINFGGYAGLDIARMDLLVVTLMFAALIPLTIVSVVNAYYAARPAQGRILSRYALHVFYPGHMLALWLISLLI